MRCIGSRARTSRINNPAAFYSTRAVVPEPMAATPVGQLA